MSLLISQLESHPFHPSLQPESPYLKWLTCMSDYAPDFPAGMKRQVKHPRMWPKLAHQLARSDRRLNSFLATTQAADLIRGGVKVNALPEVVEGEPSPS
jgi:Gly-Xaa carboxypeptidase